MKKPKPTDEQIEQEREESQGNNRMKHQKCVSIEALHEAGHAVMYVYLRHPFKSVDIVDKPHDEAAQYMLLCVRLAFLLTGA
jgi:hypothetical protein